MALLKEANPFDNHDDTMDALLKEAITEFEECRTRLNRTAGRQHRSTAVNSSTHALKNLI